MKVVTLFAVLLLTPLLNVSSSASADKTITKIVKALQKMLDDIGGEGEAERVEFAKMKCYCDTNTDEKTASIAALTKEIAVLSSQIDRLISDNSRLSIEAAELQTQMDANVKARSDASGIRTMSNEAFTATEKDLTAALEQMTEAINVLTAIGADQSLAVGADHKQFMAGHELKKASLVKLEAQVATALKAASGLMDARQRNALESFLQAPFTGTYTSQSSAVVGILKQMKTTFTENLASARKSEADEKAAFDAFTQTKLDEFNTMEASKTSKEGIMSDNEQSLATKKQSLASAETAKANDEAFLEELTALCTKKTKQYEKRRMIRANERAALAEAIAILNSDEAFENFGKVKATTSGATSLMQKRVSFLQLRSGRSLDMGTRFQQAQELLKHKSARLASIAKQLGGATPFDTLLTEIDKMKKVIEAEGVSDQKNFDFCETERTTQNANLQTRKENIGTEQGNIDAADRAINEPETGLLARIAADEQSLKENLKTQADTTKTREEENKIFLAYKAEMDQAEDTLTKAIAVLKKYYADLAAHNAAVTDLLQKKQPKPEDKTSFGFSYEDKGGRGAEVISMLEFVLDATEKEEKDAVGVEAQAVTDYDTEMTGLKKSQSDLEGSITSLHASLAEEQKKLLEAQQALKDEIAAKEAIEAYLLKIKPGCDFITANLEMRKTNRADELGALDKVIEFITKSPAYLSATTLMKVKGWGQCESTCSKEGENHVKCKACLASTSVPGYCAGHRGEAGLIGC